MISMLWFAKSLTEWMELWGFVGLGIMTLPLAFLGKDRSSDLLLASIGIGVWAVCLVALTISVLKDLIESPRLSGTIGSFILITFCYWFVLGPLTVHTSLYRPKNYGFVAAVICLPALKLIKRGGQRNT